MSPTALLRALVALVVIVFAWGAFALFRGALSDAGNGLDLPTLGAADVDRVELAGPADTVLLRRDGDAWTVNGHRAARGPVEELLGALTDTAASSELVAKSATSHARLGVDSGAGRRVRVARGDAVLLDVIVGERGRGYQTAYVRRAGASSVYQLRGRLASLVERDVDAWRDRRIASLPADTVGTVIVTRGPRGWTVTRAEAGWTVAGRPADSAAVARLLGAFADVSATGFATDAQRDSLDFRRPDRTVTVLGLAGDTLLALAIDSTGGGYWARRGGDETVFRLDFWRADELTPTDSTLRRP